MMKIFVAALCALAAVTATPLLGTEQCAKGPSVWCVNVQTADQCGAVTHCQQTVWNKPVVKSLSCDVCKEVVTAVSTFVKDNATQSEMMSVMQKACEFLPNPALVTECKQLIQQ
ncbi:prosaposin [Hyperolius riggenbachi]|uniref:prosaposin n=1 Tax=Hyperolius riggenbachi TaxID=752182 RepID=UPI0035A39F17